MSRLHANSSSCLDFFHNAETHCTTEETRRLCCLINNIMLIISNGWEKTNYSCALNICIESRISDSLRKWDVGLETCLKRSLSVQQMKKRHINLGKERLPCSL